MRDPINLTQPPIVGRGGLSFRRDRPERAITSSYVRNLPLTERDRQMLRYLGEIGYATTDQLTRLFWPGRVLRTASRRLLRLWEMWVLDRQPFYLLPDYGFPRQLAYMLGRAGVKMLTDVDENARQRDGTLLMAHNVLLGEAIIRLTEKARSLGPGHSLSFHGEAATCTAFQWHDKWIRMRPDGLALAEYVDGTEQKEVSFYLEFDRSTQPVRHFVGKMRQYEFYLRSHEWKKELPAFPGILVVVWTRCRPKEEESPEEVVSRRQTIAEKRLGRIVEELLSATRGTAHGLRWFCQRLDLVGEAPWRVVTSQGVRQAPPFFSKDGAEPRSARD